VRSDRKTVTWFSRRRFFCAVPEAVPQRCSGLERIETYFSGAGAGALAANAQNLFDIERLVGCATYDLVKVLIGDFIDIQFENLAVPFGHVVLPASVDQWSRE
jgi:hypothetical protein